MKPISPGNRTIRPFKTHKALSFRYTYLGGNNPSEVSVGFADATPIDNSHPFILGTEGKTADGLFERPLYRQIVNQFYGLDGPLRQFTPSTASLTVISVGQSTYGEGIFPGSLLITEDLSAGKITDDGDGGLVFTNSTGSVPNKTRIGNIFYGAGILVLNPSQNTASLSDTGLKLVSGSNLNIGFRSTHTIYEHQVVCTINPQEFNYSFKASGSALSGESIPALMVSGTLQPYVTSIGLYNNENQLIAIAKVPRPVKRLTNSSQTFIIRFDA